MPHPGVQPRSYRLAGMRGIRGFSMQNPCQSQKTRSERRPKTIGRRLPAAARQGRRRPIPPAIFSFGNELAAGLPPVANAAGQFRRRPPQPRRRPPSARVRRSPQKAILRFRIFHILFIRFRSFHCISIPTGTYIIQHIPKSRKEILLQAQPAVRRAQPALDLFMAYTEMAAAPAAARRRPKRRGRRNRPKAARALRLGT